jgi:predicted MFS family arabinose efflux permease
MKRGSGLLLTSLALAASLGYVSGVALNPFLVAIARELGTTVPLVGQIPAITLTLSAGLGLAVGPLADRLGHRRILLLGLFTLVLGSAGTALAASYALLVLASAVGSISQAILLPVALAIIGDRFARDERRGPISLVMASTSAAQIVAIPLLTTVAGLLDWRAAFLVLAAVALVVTLIELRAIPPDTAPREQKTRPGEALAAYLPIARHAPTLGLIVSSGFRGIGSSIVFIYLGAFLVERYGLSIPQVGWAYTATGVSFLVGSLAVAGRLGGLAPRPMQVGGLALAGLVLAAALLFPVSALAASALATAGFALIAAVNSAGASLLASETPAGQATTMTGNQASNVAGWAIGSSLGGLLIALGGYDALGWSTLVACLIAGLVIWVSRPRPIRQTALATPPIAGESA